MAGLYLDLLERKDDEFFVSRRKEARPNSSKIVLAGVDLEKII